GPGGVRDGVERLDGVASPSLEVLGVLLLDVRRVCEHDGAEIPRGGSGPDVPAVAVADEEGEAAGVGYVGEGEHDGVDLLDGEREFVVFLVGFLASALVEAAVEEDGFATDAEDVAGTGDFAGGTGEFDFHVASGVRVEKAGTPCTSPTRVTRYPSRPF